MLVAGVLILAVQSAVVSGRLTVLEGKDLVCVSDDDGAGLTWNTNMDTDPQSDDYIFQNPNKSRSSLECELNQIPSCINSWSTKDWNLTSSMVTPMGPVLDRRWEDNFLHTKHPNAVLVSPELSVNTTNFCVEMAVGLCAECHLELTLANPSTKTVEHTLEVIRGSPTAHGLPAWQYVRVNKSIPLGNSTVELRMFTILKQETPNPLWAVANVRWCPPAGSIRKGRKKMSQVYGESKSSWPDVTCQKLFYNENTVVDSSHPATSNKEFVDSDCELGKVGPHCSINCTEDLQLEADCKNVKICEKAGCTCSSGYTGPRCDESCAPQRYGHDCNKTCDFCSENDCDFRTGECKLGCNQSRVTPSKSEVFRLEALANGLVNVTWSPTSRKGLREFILRIRTMCTNLRTTVTRTSISKREYLVENDQTEYKKQLYLMPSTTYVISILVETVEGLLTEEAFNWVHTPSAIAFEKGLTLKVRNDSSMMLHIPLVLNDTKHNEMHVIVKGSQPCNDSIKASRKFAYKAGIDYNDTVWRVATFPTNEFADKPFMVGDNKSYGGAINCPVKPLGTYAIAVLVTEKESQNVKVILVKSLEVHMSEVPKQSIVDRLRIIFVRLYRPIILVLILAVAAFYVYQRKKMKRQADEDPRVKMPLASCRDSIGDCKPNVNISLMEVKNFEKDVKQAIESGSLNEQYNALCATTMPGDQNKSWGYGILPQNFPKNRFPSPIVYDEDRVKLEKLPDDPHSDYINANYIKDFMMERCYIATQGPIPSTVNDFWRMIWQERSLIICMMADVIETKKTNCNQYWPNIGKKMKYGDIVVYNMKQTVYADYTFRIFDLICGNETRKIEHLHYTAWPYQGVPSSPQTVLKYLEKLNATSRGNGPIVVHGIAGLGRTGTIILCDICLRRIDAKGMIDVFAEAKSIRSQRANMIDNEKQYLFAHLTLLEYVLSISTPIPSDTITPEQINKLKSQLQTQHESIEKATELDGALRQADPQMFPSNMSCEKDRFPNLASANIGRVCLTKYPQTDENSDYICAVYVDGVKMQNQYIATQSPMPKTLGDFWMMVAEKKIELIVALQPPDPNDPTFCSIVPSVEFNPYINIKSKGTIPNDYYSLEKLTLIDNMVNPPTELQVTIVTSTKWEPGKKQDPSSTIALVALWEATENIASGDGPTVVLCHDGVTGCGLYLALNIVLERMAMERECDVCWATRAVKRSNKYFVQRQEDMDYLYDAVMTYLKYFKTHANFA